MDSKLNELEIEEMASIGVAPGDDEAYEANVREITRKPRDPDFRANYQIRAVQNTIKGLEAKGEDAGKERELLKEWAKEPGWEKAGEPI